jgi:16S rRNA (cytosine967-C5)-methyltransferase
MHAKAAVGQFHQSVDVATVEFAGCRHFLEFFSHKVSYRSRPMWGMALFKIVSGEKPREIAVEVLGRRKDKEFTEDLLEKSLSQGHLSPADRRLCQELVYGIVRWEATLDWLIGRKTANRTQKVPLQNLLRLGLYQIFWLNRVPDHAAVNVTVELAKQRGFGAQSGFINAVLRGYLREAEVTRHLLSELKKNQPHIGYSHPEWLVARWQARWGVSRTAELLEWNNTAPATFARVNTLKIEPAKLLPIWREENVEYDFVRRDWLEDNLVFELKSHPPLDKLASFQQGLFYVQDLSTLLAVSELDPQPGEYILDMCAAPGGKLSYIAQRMRNEGRVVARDSYPERLKLIQINCARLGVSNVEIGLGMSSVGRGPRPAQTFSQPNELSAAEFQRKGRGSAAASPHPNEVFDRVLLDAPCSNTGVLRRRVDLRWRVTLPEIERLSKTQVELLEAAARLLKPGGTLVYSTCSLEPEENQRVVEAILSRYPEFKILRARELLPFEEATDGAYVASLKRG